MTNDEKVRIAQVHRAIFDRHPCMGYGNMETLDDGRFRCPKCGIVWPNKGEWMQDYSHP